MEKTNFEKLKKILPGSKKNVLLKNYTTFHIGGPARYFYIAETKEDLIKTIKLAKEFDLPFFILGGGSKLLVADKGFNGIVIKIQMEKYKYEIGGQNQATIYLNTPSKDGEKSKIIFVEAGVKLSDLISFCLEKSLSGLEWAAGIPGATVGGAIRGNAGAFKNSMGSIVKRVFFLDIADFKTKTFDNKDCQFGYRNSVFKQKTSLIILSAELKFKKTNKQKVEQKTKEIFDYRQGHHPIRLASAGSVFINPKKMPAGFLIEKCGLKGKQIGDARISEKHANFIVNLGDAKAEDVLQLIKLAKKEVKKKFGVELKEEIQYLGFQQS